MTEQKTEGQRQNKKIRENPPPVPHSHPNINHPTHPTTPHEHFPGQQVASLTF